MNQADVVAAAKGASLIVHGANPPGYKNWKGLVMPMLESTIAAARASGARIVFPGTVYNYGPDAFPVLTEASPQRPETRKGAIRVAMERRLEEVSREGVRTLVVRAGDFFGPRSGNNWFSQLVKAGQPVRKVSYPGAPEVGHAWAYLPDLAEAMVRLAEKEASLASFRVVHFRGHWMERGVEMAESIVRVAGGPAASIGSFPGWGSTSWRRSSPPSGRSSRCGICGRRRSSSTTPGSSRSSAKSRTRRSTRPCARRWRGSAARRAPRHPD